MLPKIATCLRNIDITKRSTYTTGHITAAGHPYTAIQCSPSSIGYFVAANQAFNSCTGVLHSCKDVPHRLVQEAADKCVEANACKYSCFKKVLGMVQNSHAASDTSSFGKLPSHSNIRGKESYK